MREITDTYIDFVKTGPIDALKGEMLGLLGVMQKIHTNLGKAKDAEKALMEVNAQMERIENEVRKRKN